MGVAVKQHIMQVVDWPKYDLQDWLKQCGLWMGSCSSDKSSLGQNSIYQAMKQAKMRIAKQDREKVISLYICSEEEQEKKRINTTCLISDDEARAVQKLVSDIINTTDSEVQLEWMSAVVECYFDQKSWSKMVKDNRTGMDAKNDVRCGLAVLHSRNPFIKCTKGKIKE